MTPSVNIIESKRKPIPIKDTKDIQLVTLKDDDIKERNMHDDRTGLRTER